MVGGGHLQGKYRKVTEEIACPNTVHSLKGGFHTSLHCCSIQTRS